MGLRAQGPRRRAQGRFEIVLRTPTLRVGSRFRVLKFEIISLCSMLYALCPQDYIDGEVISR